MSFNGLLSKNFWFKSVFLIWRREKWVFRVGLWSVDSSRSKSVVIKDKRNVILNKFAQTMVSQPLVAHGCEKVLHWTTTTPPIYNVTKKTNLLTSYFSGPETWLGTSWGVPSTVSYLASLFVIFWYSAPVKRLDLFRTVSLGLGPSILASNNTLISIGSRQLCRVRPSNIQNDYQAIRH